MNNRRSLLQKVYPWVIVVTGFLMVMTVLGFGSFTRSTFLKVVTVQLDMDRGAFSMYDAIRNVTSAILSLFFGKIILKLGARNMVGFGFVFLTVSFTINALAQSYWHFYLGGVFLGIGCTWTATSVVVYLVEHWFRGQTGTITGIILAANGLGGFIAENIVNRLIYGFDLSRTIEEGNWRLGYGVSAAIFAAVGLLSFLLIRNDPSHMGLVPHQLKPKGNKGASSSDWHGFSQGHILRKAPFYLISINLLVTGFMLQAMVSLAKTHMQDVGIDIPTINFVYSYYAFVLLGAKIMCGYLFDRIGLMSVFLISSFSSVIALLCLVFQSTDHLFFTYAYVVFAAIGLPLETVMIPLLCKDMFGRKSYAKILGYLLGISSLGMAIGTTAINWVYDFTHSYIPSLLVLIVLCIVAIMIGAVAIRMARKGRNDEEWSPSARV